MQVGKILKVIVIIIGVLILVRIFTGLFPFILIPALIIIFGVMKEKDRREWREKFRHKAEEWRKDFKIEVNKMNQDEKYSAKTNHSKHKNPTKSNKQNKFNEKKYEKQLAEALKIKADIEKQVKNSEILQDKFGGEEINKILDKHISQIKQLINRDQELKNLINSMTVSDIENQLKILKTKQQQATDTKLINEYQKNIDQYQRHFDSHNNMIEQREIIALRINSAVMSLKQLQLDSRRIKEIISDEEDIALKSFEERTKDLSDYVTNLDQSYRDLEREL
ncbi:MAG: hypothetical protein MJB14_05920 [Spirochaetes bacterium]|nr:hypothetical protein [Spirochaetota bacterium]